MSDLADMDMVLALQEALEDAAEPFALLDVMTYQEIIDTIERNSYKIARLKWLTEQGEKHMREKAESRLSASVSDLVSNIPELWRAVAKLRVPLHDVETVRGDLSGQPSPPSPLHHKPQGLPRLQFSRSHPMAANNPRDVIRGLISQAEMKGYVAGLERAARVVEYAARTEREKIGAGASSSQISRHERIASHYDGIALAIRGVKIDPDRTAEAIALEARSARTGR